MRDRPAQGPGRHWPDRPEVLGGLDVEAEGTWMAVNEAGVFATILNAKQSLGPAPGKRSRGELPLDALDFSAAADAAEALETLAPEAYRPFNLLIADASAVFLLQNDGAQVRRHLVPPGLHMISHSNLNDPSDARVRWFRDVFDRTPPPDDPTKLEPWAGWIDLMSAREGEDPSNSLTAMTIRTDFGFQTRCTALVALREDHSPIWWHRDIPDLDQLGGENPPPFHIFTL